MDGADASPAATVDPRRHLLEYIPLLFSCSASPASMTDQLSQGQPRSESLAMPALRSYVVFWHPPTWDRASILDNPGMRRLPTVGDYCGRPCAQPSNVSVRLPASC